VSNEEYPYDEDEFDVLGADRTPQGVHRAPVSRWRQLLPFVAVIVLAPLLAYVGVTALSGGFGDDDEPAATPTEPEEPPAEEDEADGENGDNAENGENGEENGDPTEDPEEETETPDPDLDLSVPVYVLNGTPTVGVAGGAAEVLTEDGWTNVNTSDYNLAQPENTEMYYNNADLAEEAEAVGEALEIEDIYENADAASAGIVIVLRPDFQ